MSLQLQLSAGTLSKSMSRMGSCEEALLPGDAGEARVSAGAPAAAVSAGAERTVPSLWVEPGDAVTPSAAQSGDAVQIARSAHWRVLDLESGNPGVVPRKNGGCEHAHRLKTV